MKLNCDNPAAGQWAARGALPDIPGQSIILKKKIGDAAGFRRHVGSAHSASPPAYSQVARAHGCGL